MGHVIDSIIKSLGIYLSTMTAALFSLSFGQCAFSIIVPAKRIPFICTVAAAFYLHSCCEYLNCGPFVNCLNICRLYSRVNDRLPCSLICLELISMAFFFLDRPIIIKIPTTNSIVIQMKFRRAIIASSIEKICNDLDYGT